MTGAILVVLLSAVLKVTATVLLLVAAEPAVPADVEVAVDETLAVVALDMTDMLLECELLVPRDVLLEKVGDNVEVDPELEADDDSVPFAGQESAARISTVEKCAQVTHATR